MSEFQTRDQKLNKLRVEFLNIAGNEDGEVTQGEHATQDLIGS